MISRYTREPMRQIWDDDNRFKIWLEIETLACEAMGKIGVIPETVSQTMRDRACFDSAKIDQIEKETKHDVIAFLTNISESVGEEARFIHQGMTSSDVLDTCLGLQLVQASDLLLEGIDKLLEALAEKAFAYKTAPMIARSHGIHAEPTTFGLVLASFYSEFKRAKNRMVIAKDEIGSVAISGAVGTFANIDPRVEEYVANALGLKYEPISTQVIPRDRHAMYFSILAVIGSSIERLAVEIRHLQRSEVGEVEEQFTIGQKGSSAMPHKRNPVLSENLTGIARMIRAYAGAAFENVALWHERDISHSSVERIVSPDATILLDFALNRMALLIKNLQVHPKQMQKNIDLHKGLYNSQRVMLTLTQAGMSREMAYKHVQACAMQAWKNDGTFKDYLVQDQEISKYISTLEMDKLFNIDYYTRHVDMIFKRVFI